ncbi:MAG: hypothetical protein RLZZ241_2499 [Bacteroidota bacterium]|jgi:ribonuclease P protein component
MATFTLNKKERLKRKILWDHVFAEGQQVKSYPFLLYYYKTELPEGIQFQAGFAVPKKNIRKAVSRNRVKRLMREVYRKEKPGLKARLVGSYALVFLYLGKELPVYTLVSKNMTAILQKWIAHETTQNN